MIILGVDLGKARTGVAVCDKNETLASPVEVVHEHNRERLLQRVASLAAERGAERIVVGLPRNMDGTQGFQVEKVREFSAKLEEAGLHIAFYDERMTTMLAEDALLEANMSRADRKKKVDMVAAVMILPLVWGLDGIWVSIVAAELIAAAAAVLFLIGKKRKYHY